MSTFDPKLLEATEIQDELETRYVPVPEGAYPNCFIEDYEIKAVNTDDGEKPILNVKWLVPDEDVKALLNRDTVLVDQDLWLDLTDKGTIATGPQQNVKLGRLLAVCNLNNGKFSFPKLRGAGPLTIVVKHRVNKNDPEDKRAFVAYARENEIK